MSRRARKQLVAVREVTQCGLWPDCRCHEDLVHWQEMLSNEDKVWTLDEIRTAELIIFVRLCCAARLCPDLEVKFYASLQLLDSHWDRLRRGEELSAEEFQRRRGMQ